MNPWKEDFPLLKKTMHGKPLVYLDSGATAQKPQKVIDCLSDFYANNYGTVHRAVYDLAVYSTKKYQEAREKIQRFLHAKYSEEIIFTRGTTESINMIAYSFGKAFIKPGDEILISEMEHHSNIVPWQIACEDRGAILKVIPVTDSGEIDLEACKNLLSNKTKIVSIAHVSNVLGTINPIKEMARLAHERGAKILVDGAQSAPRLPVDVQDLDADFYVFSGHKCYGPNGIGALYGKKELLDAMPPYQGGGDMIEEVAFTKTTYNHLPMKFEAGTPIIAEAIALGASIDYLNEIGIEKIHQHEMELTEALTKKLSEIEGLTIYGTAPNKCGVVSFTIDGIHPLDLGTLLDLKGIAIRTGHHCAQPLLRKFGLTATARASFGLYNSVEEVEMFVEALKNVIEKLPH